MGFKRLILPTLGILILLLALGVGLYLARQRQYLGSKAAVVNNIPLLPVASEIYRAGGTVNYIDTSSYKEASKVGQATLVFVNSVKLADGQALKITAVAADTGKIGVIDSGIGAQMITEYEIEPGDYALRVLLLPENKELYAGLLTVESGTVNLLIRGGNFTLQTLEHSSLPGLRFYNLTTDNEIGLLGGSLDPFNVIYYVEKE